MSKIREAALGKKIKSKRIRAFGHEIEVRQLSMTSVMRQPEEGGGGSSAAYQIVSACYDPETGQRIFEPTDVEVLAEMPFDEDAREIMTAIRELMGISVEEAKQQLADNPLDETSSS